MSADADKAFAALQRVQELSMQARAAGATSDPAERERFDLGAMSAANVYACDDEGELELAQHYFEHLVRYYADAAARGDAMLLYID